MFRIIIAGRDMNELKTNVQRFLNGVNDSSEGLTKSQALPKIMAHVQEHLDAPPLSRTATETVAAEKAQFASPPAIIPPPAASANDYGVDSRGLPWDARIHAVTQGLNKDGTWRYRRGVEKASIDQVETELRVKTGAGAVHAIPAIPESPSTTAPAPFIPPVTASPVADTPPAPLTVVPPLQPSAPITPPEPQLSTHTLETFKTNLVPTLAKLVTDGKLTNEYVQSLKNYFKVDQIWQVSDAQIMEMFENFAQAKLIAKAQ